MRSLKSMLWVGAKLALSGALICAIAWVVAVYQPDGTVQDSQADILDLNFIHLSNSARFARGLQQLGHDRPQTFSINGNIVNFSVNHSRKRPLQLMKEYQEEFVHQGLQDTVWTADKAKQDGDKMMQEAMTGGVVPLNVSDDYVAMGGVLPKNDATDAQGLVDLARSRPKPPTIFKGHHWVEMFWDKYRRQTTVTASWSDEHFDYEKMFPGVAAKEGKDIDVDLDIPACPGCNRVSRVRDLNPMRTYSSNTYASTKHLDDTLDFYRRAMHRRGWTETESSQTFATLQPYVKFEGDGAHLLQLHRGKQFLTILAYPDANGHTTIHTVMSN